MKILAIDPGNEYTGYVVVDADTRRPLRFDKTENSVLREQIVAGQFDDVDRVFIEMIASYGLAVGAEVFHTCVWIGRFVELLDHKPIKLVPRQAVKLHHCHSPSAKDANISRALKDRFAAGVPNHGKGSKSQPGWFYGFKADVWQAYAIGVYAADLFSPVQADFDSLVPSL